MGSLCKLLAALSCVGLFVLAIPSPAQADEFDKATLVTFTEPVALPGIALPAGTYLFKLADPDGAPSAVRVFDRTGLICYGTFLTIPASRPQPPDQPAVQFKEQPAHAPEAISAWFYPGDETGWEFLYTARHANG